jgi:hypothetical protein
MLKIESFLISQRRILRPVRLFLWIVFATVLIWNSKLLFGDYSLQSLATVQIDENLKESAKLTQSEEPRTLLTPADLDVQREKKKNLYHIFKASIFFGGTALFYILVITPFLESRFLYRE